MNEMELKYGCNPNQKPARVFMHNDKDFPAFRPTLPVLRAAASRTSSLPRQALQMMKTADRMSL